MKFHRVSALVFLMMSATLALTPAQARDETDGRSEDIAVEKVICQQLYVHKPAPGVMFEPGMDVYGKPVVPADLPATDKPAPAVGNMPEFIEVPLTVDLAGRLGQQVPAGVKLESVIGNLRLYKDGRITNNGEDILQKASAMCGKPLTAVPPVEKKVRTLFDEDTVVKKKEPVAAATALSATSYPEPPRRAKIAKKTANFRGRPAE